MIEYIIGPDCDDGFKVVIEGGSYQAAVSTGEYSLAGCSVAPGFDFKDFAFLSDNADLETKFITAFPEYKNLI